jgi:DNA-binding beta-propeller fold protein YncE
MAPPRYAGKVNAPDFPPDADWVNATRPLTLADLRGKLVVLDFWTSCCINCLHNLSQLRKLERKYARELVVVGVHCPKFAGERCTASVRDAVRRLGVGHPVVNDPGHRLRDAYAVRAWPTLMFVDPAGKVIGVHEGEFDPRALDDTLASMIAEFTAKGLLDRRQLSLAAASDAGPAGQLRYPAKVLADPAGGRVFVADTGHHRVLEVDAENAVVRRAFGSGEPGFVGGPARAARFDMPHGLALHEGTLFVADTGNHSIRAVWLDEGRVWNVVGTGGQRRPGTVDRPGRPVALNSPWDLVVSSVGLRLWVAMAGAHQVWEVRLPGVQSAQPWAGSGVEDLADGPRAEARFAQPSGLALDEPGHRLFVADSEASGVREVAFGPDGAVRTLVGEGLFDFGDADGVGPQVRLQHPLGVAWDGSRLFVADSYNHKVKVLDPATRQVRTLAGTGEQGFRDGSLTEAQFSEPGGISVAGNLVYVADTNNHAIRVLDLERGEVRTLLR